MQLFDSLERERVIATGGTINVPSVLHMAAIMHNVGSAAGCKKAGKSSYREITRFEPPLGVSVETYRLAALAVRYSYGAGQNPEPRYLAHLTVEQKRAVHLAGGLLCLAHSLVFLDKEQILHSLPGVAEHSQNRS
jgi:hypothetical protein